MQIHKKCHPKSGDIVKIKEALNIFNNQILVEANFIWKIGTIGLWANLGWIVMEILRV